MTDTSITDQLKQALPETLRNAQEIAPHLERLAEIERHHESAALERAFLERAPREGLLHPADALKLEPLAEAMGKAADTETGLREYFNRLRQTRPYLFARPPAATEKLSDGAIPELEKLRAAMSHGALTRQLQAVRIKRR
jgi:hypothetical protein